MGQGDETTRDDAPREDETTAREADRDELRK